MNGTDGFLDIHDSHLRVLDGNIHAKSIILDQLDITSSNITSSTVQFLNGVTAFKTTANVEIGTANLFVDTSTSNVGILTSTPTHTLDVRGTANVEVLRTSSNIEMNGGTFSLGGHMIPSGDNQYDIGSAENKIRDMYVSDNSLWIGDKAKISFDNTEDKLTFRKRKASDTFIPAKIIDLANESGEGLNTTISITDHILGKTYTPGNLGAMKLHHWLRYAKDFQSDIKLSEIFANTESDFDSTSTAEGTFSGTGALTVPSGTTAQQPTGVAGMIRFNTTVNKLQFYNGTIWRFIGGINASGGTVTEVGDYRIHTFSTVGTHNFVVTAGGDVDYLVVAGGGGGGAANTTASADNPGAGGGGAGGVLFGTISLASTSYIITCGTGGSVSTGSTSPANGGKGGNSSIASLIVAEGGGGGGKGVDGNAGIPGGCGGGGGGVVATGSSSGGTGTIGFNGGISAGANSGGGGGGGMGSVGSAGSAGGAGNGGNGIESNISGTNTYYAAGGGGGRGDGSTAPGGTGGTGGGGNGGGNGNQATAGTPFTGSGGGGGKDAALPISTGASGGSGVVIIRYRI